MAFRCIQPTRTVLLSSRSTTISAKSAAAVLPPFVFSTRHLAFLPSRVVRKSKDAEYEKLRKTVTEPTGATTSASIQQEYTPPSATPQDIGHSTTGPIKKHNKRTLASFSMENKVCVVTGAARGLGNMMARTFVESGASQVAILDLNQDDSTKAADELVEWFESNGSAEKGEIEAQGWACDVANEDSVKKVFSEIEAKWGRIDVLVTAAGIVENFSAIDYPTQKIRKLMDINVMGTYFCAREAAVRMPSGGSVILIASMSAHIVNVPQPQTPYNASKAAVAHMAKSLAVEWAPKGIRVNSLSPGYVLTALTKTILDANTELRDKWVNATPMGRMANPEDLKGAIVYLASDSSKFTTGTDIKVDGGYTAI